MCLGKYLHSMTRTEIEILKNELNLTESEEEVFDLLAKGKSTIEVSINCSISLATVGNRIRDIKLKIRRCRL